MKGPADALVGRDEELAVIRASIGGPGGAVLVFEGDPGIGKSCLLDVVADDARAAGALVARSAGEDLLADPPLGTLRRALVSVAPIAGVDLAEIRWPDPHLANDPVESSGRGLVPSGVLDQVVDQLEAISRHARVVVIVDDLQWADTDTVMSLPSLARRSATLGVDLVLAVRPQPRGPVLARALVALDAVAAVHVRVGPLEPEQVAAMVLQRAGHRASDTMLSRAEAAGGNPYYVAELVDALLEQRDAVGDLLPDSLRARLVRQVDAEGDGLSSLLHTAAVLGRRVHLDELAAVASADPNDLTTLVTSAVRSGWWSADGDEVVFRHDLVRESLLESQPPMVRRAMHRRVAARLQQSGAAPERVARHVVRGFEAPDHDAVHHLIGLAPALAPSVAVELLGEIRGELPPQDPDRAAVEVAYISALVWSSNPVEGEALAVKAGEWVTDRALRSELVAARSYALLQLGSASEALLAWEQARGDAGSEILPTEHAQLAVAKLLAGDLDGAQVNATIAIDAAEASRSAVRVARAIRAWCAGARCDYVTALHETEVALLDDLDDPGLERLPLDVPQLYRAVMLDAVGRSSEAEDLLGRRYPSVADLGPPSIAVLKHSNLAMILYRSGRWDEAWAEADAGMSVSRDSRLQLGTGWLAGVQALIAVHRGSPDTAATILADVPDEMFGPTLGLDWLVFTQATVARARGDDDEAYALLTLAIDVAASMGILGPVSYLGPDAVRLALERGDHDRVSSVLAQVDEVVRAADIPPFRAAVRHVRGLAEASPELLEQAAATFDELVRPWEAALVRADAARVAARLGADDDARRWAYGALDGFHDVGATGPATALRASLRNHGVRLRVAREPGPVDGWSSLTPTEVKVVALLGDGLSNAEIAGRLFVSRRTVESHLGRAYQKLGFKSRVALAQAAAQRSSTGF